MFTLTIRTDNSAFLGPDEDEDPGPEVARILREIAGDLDAGGPTEGAIVDSSGNKVGSWTLRTRDHTPQTFFIRAPEV